jgi:hypothetical protein
MTLVILLLGFIAFDIAAILWGADSRERPHSPEWERLRQWKGFH